VKAFPPFLLKCEVTSFVFVIVVLDPSCFDLVIKSGIVEGIGTILGESPDSVLKVFVYPKDVNR
jgi:hypothetical protein